MAETENLQHFERQFQHTGRQRRDVSGNAQTLKPAERRGIFELRGDSMNKLNRRDFLKSIGIAAIVLPVGAKADESFEIKMEKLLSRMTVKFDSLSPQGKQHFIDALDSEETKQKVEQLLKEPLDKDGLELLESIKKYFEERLSASTV